MTRLHRRLALPCLCAAALLAGCQTLPQGAPPSDTAAVAIRPQAEAFSLAGRLAASDGVRKAAGRFAWEHTPTREQFTVFSPLGQIMAQITAETGEAVYRGANGETLRETDLHTLLPKLLGDVLVTVPELTCWVQASACGGQTVTEYDRVGRPLHLTTNNGWHIAYDGYADDAPTAPVRKLTATRGDARLQLLLDQWHAR